MFVFQLSRRGMKISGLVIASILTIYAGLSTLGAAASMQIPRLPLVGSPASLGLNYQDVSFVSRSDDTLLKGWFLPASGDSVLVIVHGGFQNRLDPLVDTLNLAHDLVQKGYNLLLFDLRGRGESAGKGRSLSNMDKDIGGAIEYLKYRGYPVSKIGVIGYCSGAAGACIFASQEIIGGLVLDGCFASVQSMVNNQASERGIPQIAVNTFLPAVQLAATIFYGYHPVNLIDVVDKVSCPIFFIHEEDDDLVSTKDDVELKDASGNPRNMLWQVEGSEHARAYHTHPVEYVSRLDAFFRSALDITDSD